MKYYLAGPMSGIPQFNFPAFDAAAADLRLRGYEIISPAEMDAGPVRDHALASKDGCPSGLKGGSGHSWGDLLARDVKLISDEVQGVIFLPGWQNSRGARLEAFVGILCSHKFAYYWQYAIDPVVEVSAAEILAELYDVTQEKEAA